MGFFQDLFGSKPKVPGLDTIDISEEQRRAIEQNLSNLPYAEDLASKVNLFNETELAKQFGMSVDQIRGLKRTVGEGIGKQLKGEFPEDVLDSIQTAGAARGLWQGVAGSPASRSWTARDVGDTSLNMFYRGVSALERWTAFNRSGMFDVSSMFFTPQQRLAFTVEERNLKFQQAWLKNQIAAMPDPTVRGIYDSIMSLVVAYLGGNYQSRNPSQEAAQAGGGFGGGMGGGSNDDFYGPYAEGPYGQPPDYEAAAYGDGGGVAMGGGFGAGFGGFV